MLKQEHLTQSILSRLNETADSIRYQWLNPTETSTRHFVVDSLLEPEICQLIYDAFPKDGMGFYSRESFREKKRTSANLNDYDPLLANITYALQDERVVNYISSLVGLKNIEPDPKLYAGGLSMMFPGDFLNPHIDNSHDGDRLRYRRLNLLYYVSPAWDFRNGGNLELWDDEKINKKTIVAFPNRLAVMETNKSSWHSVSRVSAMQPRCCVSNYYFSKISPEASDYFHVTSFTGRPEEKIKRMYSVLDNFVRNVFSKTFKIGRGTHLINQDKE